MCKYSFDWPQKVSTNRKHLTDHDSVSYAAQEICGLCVGLHNKLKVWFAIQRHMVSKIHVTLSNLHVSWGTKFRVTYFCFTFTTKAVLVPRCITKILSEIEQIPLQSSHKNTKYVVKTWISISCIPTVNRTFHSYSHLYHSVYNL